MSFGNAYGGRSKSQKQKQKQKQQGPATVVPEGFFDDPVMDAKVCVYGHGAGLK